jgi:hypothetical protein
MTFSRRRGGEYNASVMLETALIPDKSIITAKGDGPAVDLNGATTRVFLLTLTITEVLEQESIEVTIFSSADGQTWSAKPILSFPQKFYREQTPLLLDLKEQAHVKFLRAHWEVNRWGRGTDAVRFEAGLSLREIPAEILAATK